MSAFFSKLFGVTATPTDQATATVDTVAADAVPAPVIEAPAMETEIANVAEVAAPQPEVSIPTIQTILLAGEGGQGVQVIAEMLSQEAGNRGKQASYIPSFGVEQRGGVSLAFVQISDDPIGYPKFDKAQIVVAMCDRAIAGVDKYLDENSIFIFDGSNIKTDLLEKVRGKYGTAINIPAKRIANDQMTNKVANILFFGAIIRSMGGLDKEAVRALMNERFKKYTEKNPQLGEMNNRAFDMGFTLADAPEAGEYTGSQPDDYSTRVEKDSKVWECDPLMCKSCGMCITRCPKQALSFGKHLNQLGTPLPENNIDLCIACGMCQKVCPEGAIRVQRVQQGELE